jgi:hypothetical protein
VKPAHVVLFLVGMVVIAGVVAFGDPAVWCGFGASIVGALVGLAELLGRYRDRPQTAIRGPGAAYIVFNGLASGAAFLLIRAFAWRFGVGGTTDTPSLLATQLLAAGFGAVALFRTSLFTVRAGDQDIGVGPSALLATALNFTDREVDRRRARSRSAEVLDAMEGVSFDKAATPLPMYCFQIAMQNVSDDEQRSVGNVVNTLKNTSSASDRVKAYVLGATLLTVVGYAVLKDAVEALKGEIK